MFSRSAERGSGGQMTELRTTREAPRSPSDGAGPRGLADRLAVAGLADRLAEGAWLDRVADAVQPRVASVLGRSERIRDLLDGRWLGAPLHPVMTDVPVGAWTASVVLDAVGGRSAETARAADPALAIAVVSAIPTAAAGLSDWTHLRGQERRVATLHASLNLAGLALALASLAARRRGRRRLGRGLSLAGFGTAGLAAHLGGKLTFGMGVRVNRTAWEPAGDDFVPVLGEDEVPDGEVARAEVDGVPVVVARCAGGEICAIAATCSHLGGPLDEGEREGDTIICPWHRSRFDLRTGEVLAAPAVYAQPRYEARLRDGRVELRREA
jgi:nitrite reductase/ring-hydroxylating ferredoxin subunit